jgi:hypothetical protein
MPAANGIFLAGSNIIAYGANGAIWKSGDSGKSWTVASTELTKPYKTYFRGAELSLSSGRVEEVLGGATLIAVRFADYPNVCDFGVSRIASVMSLPRQPAEVGRCTATASDSGNPEPSPQQLG